MSFRSDKVLDLGKEEFCENCEVFHPKITYLFTITYNPEKIDVVEFTKFLQRIQNLKTKQS